MLLQKVRNILQAECAFSAGSKLLVGVSGGPDSVCLLDILSQLPYEIVVGHLNHKLRPSADEEMAFVKKLSAGYGFKFVGRTANILDQTKLKKSGIEEEARRERYRFLFDSAKKENAKAVAVAHQADDQIETLLMNLIRGSGLEGLTGMRIKSISEFNPEIELVRPLLNVWREEILDYCQNHHLEFRLDETNQSLDYHRSRIRNQLIPELANYNPNIKSTLLRTQKILMDDFAFLNESISTVRNEIQLEIKKGTVSLELKAFKRLPVSMQRLIIKEILEKYFFDQEIISFANIEDARKIFTREIRKTTLTIAEKIYIYISDDTGSLVKSSADAGLESQPSIDQELIVPLTQGRFPVARGWQLEVKEIQKIEIGGAFSENQDLFTAYFDKEKLSDCFTIRSWNKGDRFKPLGMKGKSIKLSDFWINRKLPPHTRCNWPLVLSGESIIWIPGFQQDHETRITDQTGSIIVLNYQRKLISKKRPNPAAQAAEV